MIARGEQDEGISQGPARIAFGHLAGNRCLLERVMGEAQGIAGGRALRLEPMGLSIDTPGDCDGYGQSESVQSHASLTNGACHRYRAAA
jgi:hypothetical protein